MRLFLLSAWLFIANRSLFIAENNKDSKFGQMECVINVQPLLLEDCPRKDGMSMCYTIEFDDSSTVLYGCAAGNNQQKALMNSTNCLNNVFKRCPTMISKFRLHHPHLHYCCCNTTKCNGYYSNRSETIMLSNETYQNNTKIMHKGAEFKRAAVDISQSGEGSSVTAKVKKNPWGMIGGIVCGAVLMLCLVGAASVYVQRRRRKQRATMNARVGEIMDGISADDEKDDENLPGMICTPGEVSSSNVVHSDRTDTAVPAQLTLMEQNALLRTLVQNVRLKAVVRSKKPPKITNVVTYATSDDITNADRSSNDAKFCNLEQHPKDDLLVKLIRNGPKQFPFKFEELREILLRGARIFLEESTLIEVPVPCVVYGDIHGQYSDLHRWFNLNGWPSQVRSVFLGDFVDRGSHGIEVIALLTALKVRFPRNIFLCRGNHEEESLNRAYSFHEEVYNRFPENPEGKDGRALYPFFRAMFNNLPLAVLIGGRILGMHGGIGPRLTSLQAIREIRRPLEEFEVGTLECDLVWSDPDTTPDHTGFRNNLEREPMYGIGQLFAPDTVQDTCRKLGIDMIIRGHQAPLHGYALFSGGCMLTLFSAPGYKGTSNSDINMGASVEISSSMNISIKQIQVTEKFRQKRIADAELRKTNTIKSKSQPTVKSYESSSLSTSSLFR